MINRGMNYDFDAYHYKECTSSLPEAERPTFYDLQKNAEAGIVRRAFARYFTTRNYERSIRRHERLGTPIVRKIVMGTVGRGAKPGGGGNYRLDNTRSRIEAATNFAYRGSVFNEAVHTLAILPIGSDMTNAIMEQRYGPGTIVNVGAAALNLSLVALQRYNRARMIKRSDEELQAGATYRPGYRSWTGIDCRAVDNYTETLQPMGDTRDSESPSET